MIREINQLLEDGYHLDVNKAPSVAEPEGQRVFTLADALKMALEIKKASVRPSSYPSYKSSVKIFTAWVEKTEAVTTVCRKIATNVKPIVLRYLDGQLKSAWNGHCVGSSSLLGKHSDTMIMDFLATIATQRALEGLDLIDA